MNRNIKVDYVYRFLSSFDITAGIWVLFLAYRGMSLVQIGLLESIFHVCSLIFEVPTGAFADLLGRKKVMILSRLASFLGCICMLLSHTFWGFAVGFIFSAFSYNLNSGSEEALVYDSLLQTNQEESYLKINSQLNILIEVAQALAVFIGGALAEISFTLSYSIALLVGIGSFGVALAFIEPPLHQDKEVANVAEHFSQSFTILKTNRSLRGWITYFPMVMTFATVIYFYAQQYFFDLGYSKVAISIIFLINGGASAMGAMLSESIDKKLKGRAWLIIPMFMSFSILMFAVGQTSLAIVMFFVLNFFNASLYPISSLYINELIPSSQRATIISLSSMIFSLMMIVFFPICGLLGQVLSLKLAFLLMGGMNLILISIISFYRRLT